MGFCGSIQTHLKARGVGGKRTIASDFGFRGAAARGPDGASRSGGSTAPAAAPPERRAYRSAAAIVTFVAVTCLAAAADLWSKHAVFDSLLSGPEVAARATHVARRLGTDDARLVLKALDLRREVGGGLRLTLSTNPGVVFGLRMPPAVVAVAPPVQPPLVALARPVPSNRTCT